MPALHDETPRLFADNGITGQVVRVIDNANQRLVMVSPYVERVPHVEQAILRAKAREARVTLYTRLDGKSAGGKRGNAAIKWFRENAFEVIAVPNLHAKFYMNENEAVVTSMNLLKSSWLGSLELGFVVKGEPHRQLIAYLRQTLNLLSASAVQHAGELQLSLANATTFTRNSGADDQVKNEDRRSLVRKKHPNAYVRWSDEQDMLLMELHRRGVSIKVLAEGSGRQPSAIRSRIKKLLEDQAEDTRKATFAGYGSH